MHNLHIKVSLNKVKVSVGCSVEAKIDGNWEWIDLLEEGAGRNQD